MINKAKNARQKVNKTWIGADLAQGLVFLNGLIVTLTVFFIFGYYLNTVTENETRRISNDTGRFLVDTISTLENTIRLTSSTIALSDPRYSSSLGAHIERNVPNLEYFDTVAWVYKNGAGQWAYKSVFENDRSTPSFEWTLNKAFLTYILKNKLLADDVLHVAIDIPGMQKEQKQDGSLSRPFAFIKAFEANNTRKGFLVATISADKIFDTNVIANGSDILDFSVQTVGSGDDIYQSGLREITSVSDGMQKIYGFFIGDKEWRVSVVFAKSNTLQMMENIPYAILIAGFIITGLGTMFVRNNYKQSTRLLSMNRKLGSQNRQLQMGIEERERLNALLVRAEKDNRAIMDAVSDIIFEVDETGKVLFLSKAWNKTTGFDVDRSMGNNLFSMCYPDDQEKLKTDFESLLTGQSETYRSFTRLRCADGSFRAVEVVVSMIRQDQDNQTRIVGMITDVEERRRAERALAQAEKKYRTIVENAVSGIYQLTPEGLYLSANPAMAKILGYNSPEEMLRLIKNANGEIYPDIAERDQFIKRLKDEVRIVNHESQVMRRDGSRIWVREDVRIVKDDQGHILFFEGSMEDITERKEAEIALKAAMLQSDIANRAKTEFIANMSHELRTPLNAIIGFSDIMRKEVMGPLGQESYAEYVKDINESGRSLLKIINEILEISKIETGQRDLKEKEVECAALIAGCVDLHASRAKQKGLIVTQQSEDMPVLIVDETAMKQAFGHIYANAIKYTSEEGRVTIFTNYDTNGTFRLSFNDTGVGMSTAEIKKALSPFGQVDTQLDRSGKGAGLGLSLTRAVMELHGGRLEILSQKGIGTTVTLAFPPERVLKKDNVKGRDEKTT